MPCPRKGPSNVPVEVTARFETLQVDDINSHGNYCEAEKADHFFRAACGDFYNGKYESSINKFLRALGHLAEKTSERLFHRIHLMIGIANLRCGLLHVAERFFAAILEFTEAAVDPDILTVATANVASAKMRQGDFVDAFDRAQTALESANRIYSSKPHMTLPYIRLAFVTAFKCGKIKEAGLLVQDNWLFVDLERRLLQAACKMQEHAIDDALEILYAGDVLSRSDEIVEKETVEALRGVLLKSQVLYNISVLRQIAGDVSEATAYLNKAVSEMQDYVNKIRLRQEQYCSHLQSEECVVFLVEASECPTRRPEALNAGIISTDDIAAPLVLLSQMLAAKAELDVTAALHNRVQVGSHIMGGGAMSSFQGAASDHDGLASGLISHYSAMLNTVEDIVTVDTIFGASDNRKVPSSFQARRPKTFPVLAQWEKNLKQGGSDVNDEKDKHRREVMRKVLAMFHGVFDKEAGMSAGAADVSGSKTSGESHCNIMEGGSTTGQMQTAVSSDTSDGHVLPRLGSKINTRLSRTTKSSKVDKSTEHRRSSSKSLVGGVTTSNSKSGTIAEDKVGDLEIDNSHSNMLKAEETALMSVNLDILGSQVVMQNYRVILTLMQTLSRYHHPGSEPNADRIKETSSSLASFDALKNVSSRVLEEDYNRLGTSSDEVKEKPAVEPMGSRSHPLCSPSSSASSLLVRGHGQLAEMSSCTLRDEVLLYPSAREKTSSEMANHRDKVAVSLKNELSQWVQWALAESRACGFGLMGQSWVSLPSAPPNDSFRAALERLASAEKTLSVLLVNMNANPNRQGGSTAAGRSDPFAVAAAALIPAVTAAVVRTPAQGEIEGLLLLNAQLAKMYAQLTFKSEAGRRVEKMEALLLLLESWVNNRSHGGDLGSAALRLLVRRFRLDFEDWDMHDGEPEAKSIHAVGTGASGQSPRSNAPTFGGGPLSVKEKRRLGRHIASLKHANDYIAAATAFGNNAYLLRDAFKRIANIYLAISKILPPESEVIQKQPQSERHAEDSEITSAESGGAVLGAVPPSLPMLPGVALSSRVSELKNMSEDDIAVMEGVNLDFFKKYSIARATYFITKVKHM